MLYHTTPISFKAFAKTKYYHSRIVLFAFAGPTTLFRSFAKTSQNGWSPLQKIDPSGWSMSFAKIKCCHWPSSFQELTPAHPDHLQTKCHTRPSYCKGLKNKMSSWSHGLSSLQRAGRLFWSFAKKSVTTDGSHYKRLTRPDDPDHLQKQSVVTDHPLCRTQFKPIQIIWKNETWYKTVLFAEMWKNTKFHHRVTNRPLFNELAHLQKPNFVLDHPLYCKDLTKQNVITESWTLLFATGWPIFIFESFQTVVNSNHPLCKPMLSS